MFSKTIKLNKVSYNSKDNGIARIMFFYAKKSETLFKEWNETGKVNMAVYDVNN